MVVLVTGGAGYIGSHTCVDLLDAGYEVVVLDNFCNSHPGALANVEKITGKKLFSVKGDIRCRETTEKILRDHGCSAVIHFAGLKAVGESVLKPLEYYDNNVAGTQRLLMAMKSAGVNTIVFSSSASVYGEPVQLPINEDHRLAPTNPYGRTKLVIEGMLRDLFTSAPDWKTGILRYFNPVGAHQSGMIGEDPQGVPNNLMPYVSQVAVGRRDRLHIWGNDYPTPDGTGVRDYIHVVDLAEGHRLALEHLSKPACFTVNLGTGRGYSVLEVVRAFEAASGRKIPYVIEPRRAGDVAASYADAGLAKKLLGWESKRTLTDMCKDTWNWQSKNPEGFK